MTKEYKNTYLCLISLCYVYITLKIYYNVHDLLVLNILSLS